MELMNMASPDEQPAQDVDIEVSSKTASPYEPSISFWSAFGIIISLQIGSGIFAAPAYVITVTQSSVLALCAWVVAGLMAWQGAASVVEFAVALPRNGGMAEYLDFCYGRYWSYLFSFAWIVIGQPCANASISLILSDHLLQAFWPDSRNYFAKVAVAMGALIGVTYLNTRGVAFGARSAVVFMVIKIMSAATIVICGLYFAVTHPSPSPSPSPGSDSTPRDAAESDAAGVTHGWTLFSGLTTRLVTALFGAMFACGGWENIGFIAGEMDNPSRNVPRVINTAMPLVLVCFLAINLSLYTVLEPAELEGTDATAAVFGQKLFGFVGGVIFAVMVVISCLGALNAVVFSAARLTQEASMRGFLPSWTVVRSLRRRFLRQPTAKQGLFASSSQSPAPMSLLGAMWTNASLAAMYLLLGSFRRLILFKGVVEAFFYFVAISGIFTLRSKLAATSSQTYKVSTAFPLVFCAASIFVVLWQALTELWVILAFSVLFLVASAAYYLTRSHIAHSYALVEQG